MTTTTLVEIHVGHGKQVVDGLDLLPVLFDVTTWLLVVLLVFSLWTPALLADVIERRRHGQN